MIGNKHFFALVLLVLYFVVSCTAEEVRTYANVTIKEPRAMSCTDKSSKIKICRNSDKAGSDYLSFHYMNLAAVEAMPTSGSYTSWSYCRGDPCVSMSTLTGSSFTPYKYVHVFAKAKEQLNSYFCKVRSRPDPLIEIGDMEIYPMAVDLYMKEYNFRFSWWHSGDPYKKYTCHNWSF